MKILLLGKNGMLGSEFLRLLSNRDGIELTATDRDGFDITDEAALADFVQKTAPEVVINCAAYTFVDNCEENKDLAFKVNSEAPKNVAKLCKKYNALLIHFSTDYVFDGTQKEYTEIDKPNPLNVYGASKLEGEKNIANEWNKYFIFRISTLFGFYGGNFVRKIYESAKFSNEIEVIDDYVSCPTYAADLAERIVNDFVLAQNKPEFGLYHLANEGFVGRYEYAKEIVEFAGLKTIVKQAHKPVPADGSKKVAERPHFSILKSTKIKPLRHFREALKVYLYLIKR